MQYLFEHIELLWIIPVVAFGFFIFLLQFFLQRREDRQELSKEVERFNTGTHTVPSPLPDAAPDRLNQLERAISVVTDSLTSQQRAIEQFKNGHGGESDELKNKLRELYKEYDIILSENYSLRAKVKKLLEHPDTAATGESPPPPSRPRQDSPHPSSAIAEMVDLKLYEDTQTLSAHFLEDTSELE